MHPGVAQTAVFVKFINPTMFLPFSVQFTKLSLVYRLVQV